MPRLTSYSVSLPRLGNPQSVSDKPQTMGGRSSAPNRIASQTILSKNKYLAIPLFLLIMLLVFWLTFGVIGAFLSDYLAVFIAYISSMFLFAKEAILE